MKCSRCDEELKFGPPHECSQGTSGSDSPEFALLTDLRAAVDLAAKALERDKHRPVRQEIAAELRRTFGAIWDKHS